MNILGINAYHGDVSAVLVRDGELVAAVEEERFRRIKHVAGFPHRAIRACLEMGGLEADDVDHVGVSRNPRAHLLRKALFALRHRPEGRTRARSRGELPPRRRDSRDRSPSRSDLPTARSAPAMHWVEHHPAHLASAFFVSPFDEAAVCAIDGFGDFVSTSWAIGAAIVL